MSDSAAMEPNQSAAEVHEHQWRLVSTETDGRVVVREFLCSGCPAILIEE